MKFKAFSSMAVALAITVALASCGGNTSGGGTTSEGGSTSGGSGGTTGNYAGNYVEDFDISGFMSGGLGYTETFVNDADVPNPADGRANSENTFIMTDSAPPAGVFQPTHYVSSYDGYIIDLVFDSLIASDREGNIKPVVAESYEFSNDDKTITFKIREGIKFSDGEELTAEDVSFTYHVMADPTYDGRFGTYVDNIVGYEEYSAEGSTVEKMSGIEIIDDYTISFTFNEVERANLINLDFGIIPEHYYAYEKGNLDPLKEKHNKPIGSGAYTMDIFEVDQYVELSLREDYVSPNTEVYEQPSIEKIIYKVVDDRVNVEQMLLGEIDYLPAEITPEKIITALDSGFINAQKYSRSGYGYIKMNNRDTSPTSDKLVRQALQYAYNGEAFNQVQFDGLAMTQNVPMAQTSWAYTDKLKNELIDYGYDLDKANALLDEAGWEMSDDGFRYKDGEKLSIRMPAMPDHSILDTLVPILMQDWGNLGIDLKVDYMEFNSLSQKLQHGEGDDWDVFFLATTWTTADPHTFDSTWKSNSNYNYIRFNNERVDELLDEGVKIMDQQEAIPYYEEIASILNEEAHTIVVYANIYHDLYNNRIEGVNTHSLWPWYDAIGGMSISSK